MIPKEKTIIGGPISYHYYKIELSNITRHIILFGDHHTPYTVENNENIISIIQLLKKIIRKSPHCIDLYAENIIFQHF